MKFGPVTIALAEGAILAHGEPRSGLKKGRTLTAEDIAVMRSAGVTQVTVARLEPGDVGEDDAARRLAKALSGQNARVADAFTGRVNLYATAAGLVRVDAAAIDAINAVDESLTVATLAPFEPVRSGAMLATIKIIPYAAPEWAVAKAEEIARDRTAISIDAFLSRTVTLISTETPGFKRSLLEKNRQVTEDRIAALGSTLVEHLICPHMVDQLANMLRDARGEIALVFGATANSDRADVIPLAIQRAGGMVKHIGMPVDPGNLLVLGSLNGIPVVGLPGCARSPKRNGFDFVLERLCAGVSVSSRDIMGMGVGGLLKEISVRGQPRETRAVASSSRPKRVAAIVLAAGRSSRMGENKLLMPIAGQHVLIHTLNALREAGVSSIHVVTGHDEEQVRALLPPDVARIHNPAFASGMASSLKAGIAATPDDASAALVVLGDMPAVRAEDIAKLIAAFDPAEGRGIVVPVHLGKRGHPVLFGRAYWPAILDADGDQGARQVLIDNADAVCEVAIDHPGVLMDADTPEALAALRRLMDP